MKQRTDRPTLHSKLHTAHLQTGNPLTAELHRYRRLNGCRNRTLKADARVAIAMPKQIFRFPVFPETSR
jgi:hypothetical protein